MDFTLANNRADLALSWLADGRAAEALIALDEIVAAYPDVDRFVFRRGSAAECLGQWESALRDFLRAIEIHPQFGIFHHAYIRLLIAREGCEAALEAYRSIRNDFPAVAPEIFIHLAQEVLVAGCKPSLLLQFPENPLGKFCDAIWIGGHQELPHGTLKLTYNVQGFTLRVCPFVLQRRLLVARLFAIIPYFDRLAMLQPSEHTVLLALDDLPPEGDEPVLCFSGYKDNHLLIPDALFLESDGYRQLQDTIDAHWVPWDQRFKKAYWRGALTGVAWEEQQVLDLPRVKLAKLAHATPNLDARITDLQQFASIWPDISTKLEDQNLLGPREPEIVNIQNQILIDVDGNSNAWSGFFLKLLCGSPTIKLMSHFRQWYYTRLTEGVHFIPISDLESALPKSIDWLLAHPAQAEAIGKAARQLALSMTPESEFGAFHEAFAQAQKMSLDKGESGQVQDSSLSRTANIVGTKRLGDALADLLTKAVNEIRSGSTVQRYTPETVADRNFSEQLGRDLEQGHLVWVQDVWGPNWPTAAESVFSLCIHHSPMQAAVLCSHGTDLVLCKPADHDELAHSGLEAVQGAGFLVSRIALFGWNTLRVSTASSDFTA